MIATVTLNPSIDRQLLLTDLAIGEVNRAELDQIHPGGKGVNVSRALKSFGAKTFAILIGASLGGKWFDEKLTELDIDHEVIMTNGVTRSNLTIVEKDGTVTKINEQGFGINEEILNEVRNCLSKLDLQDQWVVFAGRMNRDAPTDTYRQLAQYAKGLGARVAIDASDNELRDSIWSDGPDLIKPNQHELATLVGRELITLHDVIDAAREVISSGVKSVLCSLGADGAVLITANTAVHVEPTEPVHGIPVGAGDILLATFIGGGADTAALANAVAWSAASVALPGTSIPTPAQAAAVKVLVHENVDDARSLVEVS